MARTAQRRSSSAKANARRRRSGGGRSGGAQITQDTMFFPRLRRQAKWMFIVLIVVFGAGFVFLGVGSGGLDLGTLIQNLHVGGSSKPSLSKALDEVQKNPSNPA